MSHPRTAECPECSHQFPVARDEGNETQCPKCEFGLFVEWTDGEDGESVRLILPEIIFVPPPPNDRLDAVMFALQCTMTNQMGAPREFFAAPSTKFIEQSTIRRRYTTVMEEIRHKLSIRTQAEYMGMRLENNRKRMRKRVRQRFRRWTILDEHWTNNPRGDW